MKTILALALLVTAIPAVAQTKKTQVYFSCTCNDATGSALACAIRDQLAVSPRYLESTDTKVETYQLQMVTMDPSESNAGRSAIYAIAVTFGYHNSVELFDTLSVGICARDRVSTCASDVMATVDRWARQ